MRAPIVALALLLAAFPASGGPTSGLAQDASPGASGKIAFIGKTISEDVEALYVVDADGSGLTRLTPADLSPVDSPVWSADGSKMAFVGTSAAIADYGLYVVGVNGGGLIRLTHIGSQKSDYSWSPDGSKIVFERDSGALKADGTLDWEVFVISADGSGETNLTYDPNDSFHHNRSPDWSPDGTRIAYNRVGRIYLMDTDGSNRAEIPNQVASSWQADWSPDGTKIAYFSNRLTGNPRAPMPEVFVTDAYGSAHTYLDEAYGGGPLGGCCLDWRPDSSRITYARQGSIYTIEADGSDKLQVTRGLESYVDDHPVWSPDGAWIAFVREPNRSSLATLVAMMADGSRQVELVREGQEFWLIDDPAWQPVPAAPGPPPAQPPSPSPPVVPPPPCPAGTPCVQLAAGCQIVSLAAYPPGTSLTDVTGAITPADAGPRLWFHEALDNSFTLYDPASPERSAKTALEPADEAGFLCVDVPAAWARGGPPPPGTPTPAPAPTATPPPPPSSRQRSTTDLPDDSPAYQVHLMYVVPSDGADQQLDTNGAIAALAAGFQDWLAAQSGGARLRLDTYQGVPDITFLRLDRPGAEMATDFANQQADALTYELLARGFDHLNKVYAVYLAGDYSFGSCGVGGPPVAVVFVGSASCYPQPLSVGAPRSADLHMLHEIVHAIGFVAPCAPHYDGILFPWSGPGQIGHVSELNDLMSHNREPGQPPILDVGRDDYYGHNTGGCPDLQDSVFLEPLPRGASLSSPAWPLLDLQPLPCDTDLTAVGTPAALQVTVRFFNATPREIAVLTLYTAPGAQQVFFSGPVQPGGDSVIGSNVPVPPFKVAFMAVDQERCLGIYVPTEQMARAIVRG